ncbi:EAL domain-containing protein [Ferribacterium limneticum]|uniref:EAL domain-containing protein n=1 Tax=Ferribacterium limneticum TaxID=76259 RepID=UPI001CF9F8B2|nr:EAL domain-containing protein [Ferribacterium limneticum]UCV29839.1 EAL domain-containing protein [Ferribacterium limneticum]UCV33758.1 EAL domain-containing protein [Ferribacterium limneticum]
MDWVPPIIRRFLGFLLVLFLTGTAHAESDRIQSVRIGVLAYRGTQQAIQEWQGHADYLGARLPGRRFEIVPLGYAEIDEAVRTRSIELLITNTGHYTELETTGNVSRIATRLIASPSGPLKSFGGTAITLASRTDIAHYRDLKGKRLLIPDKSSLGGWQVHLREALDQKIQLENTVSALIETANHEKVVHGVLAGDADAGFVRSDLIEAMITKGTLQPGALKVIDARNTAGYPYLHSTRLYPEWPLARVGDFPEDISKAILVALLAMSPDDAAAQQAHIAGWTLPQNYQPVLDLFREARLGPYARQDITWSDIMARHGVELMGGTIAALLSLLLALGLMLRSNRILHDSEASSRLSAGVFKHAEEGILITDAAGHIVRANDSVCSMTGYSHAELIGQTPRLFRSSRQSSDFYDELWKVLLSNGAWRGEIWNQRKDGTIYAQRTSISSIRDRDGMITHFIGLFYDITELKQSQDQLEKLAYYDALTGLPNRLLLADRLKQAIAQSNRRGDLLAVCYLDLDNFKPINDRWGHQAGDRLLVEVARRLTQCLRQHDTVSRLGGDEFVLLISELGSFAECEQALQRIGDALNVPFIIDSEQAGVTASFGVTIYPADSTDPDTLLRHADQAMYAAKQAGRHRFQLYHQQSDFSSSQHREHLSELRRGLENREFLLHYQPKADMRAGRIIGAEALLRWQHPDKGLLYPDSFLFMFEQTGLHLELGEYVIDAALTQMASWARNEQLHLAISVNIDAQHLQRPDFACHLQDILQRHPTVSPQLLELEIVETAALQDLSQVSERISECRKLGVQFAIDDFGTGYSSLSYLKQLPMQTLKIDRSFVHDMLDDPDDLAIVDGVVGLASAFRRRVIAEGVETVAHGTLLLHLGCEWGQGYGISRPMPAADLPAWIKRWRAPPEWHDAIRWPPEDLPLLTVEVDHIRWVRQFEALINAEPDSGLPVPPLDAHACRFGQWLDSDDFLRYAHLQAVQKIVPIHDEVHRCGAELVHLYADNPPAARQRLGEIFQLRDKLLASLGALRQAVIHADIGSANSNSPTAAR